MTEIKVIKGNQAGGVFYSGMMSVKDIVNEEICTVRRLKQKDFADASPQRPLDESVAKRIAKDIIGATDGKTGKTGGLPTPTGILLACDQDLEYDEQKQVLIVPDGVVLSIMDGQHRVEGWKIALGKNENDEILSNSTIPVTIITEISPINKLWQFYSCNYLAKKPTKDQSYNLIAHVNKQPQAGVFIPTAARSKDESKAEIGKLVEFVQKMNESDASVWKNHIIMDGEKGAGAGNKTRMRAMVDVLRKRVMLEGNTYADEAHLYPYWRVLSKLLQGGNTDSALFKSTGCEVFNYVYTQFMQVFSKEYGRDYTDANIEALWVAVFDRLDEDKAFIKNPEFWQIGSNVAGHELKNYASREPRKELINAIANAITTYDNRFQE